MDDLGFNGTGSRFNSRFGAGQPILAKQLNELTQSVQSSLPMPYIGAGTNVSFLPGGSIITTNEPMPESTTQLLQHNVFVNTINNGETTFSAIQVVIGTIIIQNLNETIEYTTQSYGVWPTSAYTIGTDSSSPYIGLGGYIKLATPP